MNFVQRFVAMVAMVAIMVLIIFAARGCYRAEKEVTERDDIQEIKADSVQYWKDAAGREHAARRMAEGSISSIKSAYKAEIDSLKKILKIKKDSHLQGFVAAGTQTAGRVMILVDSSRGDSATHFQHQDKWIYISGVVGKQSYLQYRVNDSLTFTTYTKKVGLFRRETFIDGFSHNPNTRITGITGVRVGPAPSKRFGIGPYAGYGYDGHRWAPAAGISIHYSLIRF